MFNLTKTKNVFLLLLLVFILPVLLSAQSYNLVKKNSVGDYPAITIFSGTDVSTADTSDVFRLPYDVTKGIFYLEVDTVTTSDTLKSMIIQESADLVKWVNSGFTLSNVTAAGVTRKATTEVSNYFLGRNIRFIFAVGGSAVKLDFKLKFVPKF